jgi:hypothetical protein
MYVWFYPYLPKVPWLLPACPATTGCDWSRAVVIVTAVLGHQTRVGILHWLDSLLQPPVFQATLNAIYHTQTGTCFSPL